MNYTFKSKFLTITLVLMVSISAIVVALPIVNAQAMSKQSFPYIGAIPNPVGVNQQVLLHIGITDGLQLTHHGFEGLTVTVTDPQGHEEILGPYRTDSTGGTGTVFVPTMTGTYSLVMNFPGQWYNFTGVGQFGPVSITTYYEASNTEPLELIVNEDAIEYYPGNSLPNEYWTRPIDAQLWEWYSIAGNWLSIPENLFAPYNNDAPNTPHILWSKTLTTGGLVGGELSYQSYEDGDAYEGMWENSVILGGVLYYNRFKTGLGAIYPIQEVVAVDLHTGEEYWCKTLGDNERLAFGQNFYWDSYNYHGTFDYLWTTVGGGRFGPAGPITWNAYDPINGELVYSIENVPSGTRVTGSKGEFYIYTVDTMNGWMTLWNSSRVVSDSGSWMAGYLGQGFKTYDATLGIEWNKTIPTGLVGSVNTVLDDRLLGSSLSGMTSGTNNAPISLWAIDLSPGNEGELLFDTTWSLPTEDVGYLWDAASLEDEVFVISAKETRKHFAFDIDSGDFLWETDSEHYLDMWSHDGFIDGDIVYGKFINLGYSGTVYAYDLEDGKLLWTYFTDDTYSEILWGNGWPLQLLFFTDGKLYFTHSEHSAIDPKPRGAPFVCLDVETGEEVFRVDGLFRGTGWGGNAIIGDSIIATMNTYDQQIYAIGKGATVLTADVRNDIALGSSATVYGSILDVSPGTNDAPLQLRFPSGVPAIADEDMGDWMKYVYQQFERPADAKGVTVILCAIDPNGNYMDIQRTTSDSYGNWALSFKPELEGTYQIIATFEGSESYYGSTSTTYLTVDPAPAVGTPIDNEPVDNEPVDAPVDSEEPTGFITTELIIIVAVAVAAVICVAAYFLLKRK